MIRDLDQNTNSSMEELRAIVKGYVQGVGFRYFVIHRAQPLGLRGYTRNLSNGDVEVVAQGPRPTLERLLAQLRRGPSAADVEEVQVTWQQPTELFSGFHVRW